MKKMILMLLAAAVVFGGIFGFIAFRDSMIADYFANMPKPVIAVVAQPAAERDWEAVVPAVGILQAQRGVEVNSAVAGIVQDIRFVSGQRVRRGDVLVRLDADVEISDKRSAEAELALARTSAGRARTLAQSRNIAEASVERAEADLQVRAARVAALEAMIQKRTIGAPFDGVLGIRLVNIGQYLDPGQPIVSIQDLSVVLCDFTVSQKDLPRLAIGQEVRLTTDAYPGHVFTGTLSAIEPAVAKDSGMVLVQARIPNSDEKLRPGMFAKVAVALDGSGTVVAVPQTAISYSLYGDSVFVVRDGGGEAEKTVERVVVSSGERRGGEVAIVAGVKPGDLVVTAGQLKLDNGTQVSLSGGQPLTPPAVLPKE